MALLCSRHAHYARLSWRLQAKGSFPTRATALRSLKAGMLVEFRKDTNKNVLVLLAEPNGKIN